MNARKMVEGMMGKKLSITDVVDLLLTQIEFTVGLLWEKELKKLSTAQQRELLKAFTEYLSITREIVNGEKETIDTIEKWLDKL